MEERPQTVTGMRGLCASLRRVGVAEGLCHATFPSQEPMWESRSIESKGSSTRREERDGAQGDGNEIAERL